MHVHILQHIQSGLIDLLAMRERIKDGNFGNGFHSAFASLFLHGQTDSSNRSFLDTVHQMCDKPSNFVVNLLCWG